jgi:hypothetical protein
MVDKLQLPVVGAPSGLGRREVLQGLLAAGTGLALPAVAEDHPIRGHLSDASRVAAADAGAGAADVKPAFLDAQQLATFTSLAELVVPGSGRAGVAPFVDRLLAVDKAENQTKFVGALGALEAEASARYGHGWSGLTEAQRIELLTAASTAAPARPPRFWRPGQPVIVPEEPPAAPTLRDRFDHLKGWIAGAYYSSEIGVRELGWTGNVFFASFPGCEHPGGHRS